MVITQEYLKERLRYNPISGLFTWVIGNGAGVSAGSIITATDKAGYVITSFKGFTVRNYKVHSLAFLHMLGYLPTAVDHIDGIKHNNAWSNLREATSNQNNWNQSISTRSSTKIKGITWYDGTTKTGLGYLARVSKYNVRESKWFPCSSYANKEDTLAAATNWVQSRRKQLHGEFTNHG
jgi:hypothetical protein